ncbi:hypothetical protein HNV12_05710 [Methanococcoides sp. SA1]|nr:hypothetical protein [Methanococcoides sp. SA1]
MRAFEMRRHFILIFLVLCSATLMYVYLPFGNGSVTISAQQEDQMIEDILFNEISLALNNSNVQITGVNYYENINSIVIGLESRWLYTSSDVKISIVDSVLIANSVIVTHPDELAGKKIIFTGSAIKRNGKGDQNLVKIFQTEIAFDDAIYVDWDELNGPEGQSELINTSFEYVWWHSDLSSRL